MEPWMTIILCVVSFIASGVIFGFIAFKKGHQKGEEDRKRFAEAEIGSAEEQAKKIINDAARDADAKKKETIIEAKDEIHKLRTDADREIKERRTEVSRQERRLVQKEESLDKKMDNLEAKEELLQKKLKQADEKLIEAERIKNSQIDNLERISGLTAEQAKEQSALQIMSSSSRRNARQKHASISRLRSAVVPPIRSRRLRFRLLHFQMMK